MVEPILRSNVRAASGPRNVVKYDYVSHWEDVGCRAGLVGSGGKRSSRRAGSGIHQVLRLVRGHERGERRDVVRFADAVGQQLVDHRLLGSRLVEVVPDGARGFDGARTDGHGTDAVLRAIRCKPNAIPTTTSDTEDIPPVLEATSEGVGFRFRIEVVHSIRVVPL